MDTVIDTTHDWPGLRGEIADMLQSNDLPDAYKDTITIFKAFCGAVERHSRIPNLKVKMSPSHSLTKRWSKLYQEVSIVLDIKGTTFTWFRFKMSLDGLPVDLYLGSPDLLSRRVRDKDTLQRCLRSFLQKEKDLFEHLRCRSDDFNIKA
tara:strand:+ start:92 stop:541 length:450 start_codon:yes stop_codon:yes gene_type:complete